MSKVIELINAVHSHCDVTWLSSSQRSVYEALMGGYRSQRVLNVYGDTGAGKTLLAWVLEKEGYGVYCPDSTSLPKGTPRVIIDRFSLQQRAARRLIDLLPDLEIRQAVVLTARRLDEDIPTFEVRLTAEDISQVKANLSQFLGAKFYSDRVYVNLHQLVDCATI